MTNTTGFLARPEYETVIGALPKAFSAITKSTLRVRNTGAPTAIVDGELHFAGGLRLRVIEAIDFKTSRLQAYAYTLWRGETKLGWFDSTPLNLEPHLAENFPHHYHDLSGAVEQRASAPALSFTRPNLPAVIGFTLQIDQPPASVAPAAPAPVSPVSAPARHPKTAPLVPTPDTNGRDHLPSDAVIVEADAPQPLPPAHDN